MIQDKACLLLFISNSKTGCEMKTSRIWLRVVLIAFSLASCAPGTPGNAASTPAVAGESTSAPFPIATPAVELPAPSETPKLEPGQVEWSQIAAPILAVLSKRLGIPVGEFTILSFEEVQWPDGCLGAAKTGEICTQAIVDGYRIILEASGKQREFHTNLDGTQVREAASIAPKGEDGMVGTVEKARQYLAQELGVDPDEIKLQSAKAVDWPDACLGMAKPGQVCTPVITPGYQVVFNAGDKQYEVRVDKAGGVLKMAQEAAQPSAGLILITWQRRGGIAAFCDDLTIYDSGWVSAVNCRDRSQAEPNNFHLTDQQLEKVIAWRDQFASFEVEQKDAAVADAMSIKMVFIGAGNVVATPGQQQEMLSFAQSLYMARMK